MSIKEKLEAIIRTPHALRPKDFSVIMETLCGQLSEADTETHG